MATQVRPLSGGSWNNVTRTAQNTILKSQALGVTLRPGMAGQAHHALSEWVNCGGTGTAAARAQARAAALGLQIQEV